VSTASLVQTEARQECLDMDADLPSVSDQSEMDFLLSVSSVTIHTHPFNGPFSGITQVSRYQKDKTNLDFTEARDSEWQWHQLGHMQVCITLQTDNHASTPPLSFLQAGCPACRKLLSKIAARRTAAANAGSATLSAYVGS